MTEFQVLAWSGIVAAVVGALSGGFVSHWLSVSHQRQRSADIRGLHIAALRAEIEYCGKLAGTYATQGIMAPLYRFPKTVYETVYPTLVSEILSDADVTALTSFYSQVDQMNRGLDAMDGYRAVGNTNGMNEEFRRLKAKAAEMRHPMTTLAKPDDGDFYTHAMNAVSRHGQ